METFHVRGVLFLACCLMASAVPTPERMEALGRRAAEGFESTTMDEIFSMSRLMAHDAHTMYRKSFEGLNLDSMGSMLDQMFEGQVNLWQEFSLFGEEDGETDSEEEETEEDVFTDVLRQLRVSPETMTTLLTSTDKLEVDNKRLETMMEMLKELSDRIKQRLERLVEEADGPVSWIKRWVVRELRSSMRAMLRVLDTIREAVEDAKEQLESEMDVPEVDDESESEEELAGHEVDDRTNGEGDRVGIEPLALRLQHGTVTRHRRSTVTRAAAFVDADSESEDLVNWASIFDGLALIEWVNGKGFVRKN